LIENEKSIVELPLGLSPDGYSSWTVSPLYILFCLRKQKRERPSLKISMLKKLLRHHLALPLFTI